MNKTYKKIVIVTEVTTFHTHIYNISYIYSTNYIQSFYLLSTIILVKKSIKPQFLIGSSIPLTDIFK